MNASIKYRMEQYKARRCRRGFLLQELRQQQMTNSIEIEWDMLE